MYIDGVYLDVSIWNPAELQRQIEANQVKEKWIADLVYRRGLLFFLSDHKISRYDECTKNQICKWALHQSLIDEEDSQHLLHQSKAYVMGYVVLQALDLIKTRDEETILVTIKAEEKTEVKEIKDDNEKEDEKQNLDPKTVLTSEQRSLFFPGLMHMLLYLYLCLCLQLDMFV